MHNKLIFFFLGVSLFACTTEESPQALIKPDSLHCNNEVLGLGDSIWKDSVSIQYLPIDSFLFAESVNEEDQPDNAYLQEELKRIRENFKRINSIKEWNKIKRIDLRQSTEGGDALFYYDNIGLEKIIEKNYGETGQTLHEYYFYKGNLSFVFEKICHYEHPITNDSFAFDDSMVEYDRFYFEKGKLIHWSSSSDCGAPFPDNVLLEQDQRLKKSLKALIEREKK